MTLFRICGLLVFTLLFVEKAVADSFSILLDYGVDSNGGEQAYLAAGLPLSENLMFNAGLGESRQDTLVSPTELDTVVTETVGVAWSSELWQLNLDVERWGDARVLQTVKNGILLDLFAGDFTLSVGLARRDIRLITTDRHINGYIRDFALVYHGIADVDFIMQHTQFDYDQNPRDICKPLSSTGIPDPCLVEIQLLQNAAEEKQQSLGVAYYLGDYDFNFTKSKLVNAIDASTVWFNMVSLGTVVDSLYFGLNYSWRENANNDQVQSYGMSLMYQF